MKKTFLYLNIWEWIVFLSYTIVIFTISPFIFNGQELTDGIQLTSLICSVIAGFACTYGTMILARGKAEGFFFEVVCFTLTGLIMIIGYNPLYGLGYTKILFGVPILIYCFISYKRRKKETGKIEKNIKLSVSVITYVSAILVTTISFIVVLHLNGWVQGIVANGYYGNSWEVAVIYFQILAIVLTVLILVFFAMGYRVVWFAYFAVAVIDVTLFSITIWCAPELNTGYVINLITCSLEAGILMFALISRYLTKTVN